MTKQTAHYWLASRFMPPAPVSAFQPLRLYSWLRSFLWLHELFRYLIHRWLHVLLGPKPSLTGIQTDSCQNKQLNNSLLVSV